MPPRCVTTVGIAVATTVDSIAARKMDSMIPKKTHRFRVSSFIPPSVAAGATGAAAQRAQVGIRVEARVPVEPRHAEPLVRPLDLFGPRHLGCERLECAAPAARAVVPEAIERVDGPVAVGPVHPERVAADEVHVLRDARIGLAEDLQTDRLLHVPPPTLVRSRRIPARR